ncbi:MAG TPA: hypothetical protein VIH61_07830, partial [Waddliaceae bacterium]
MSFDSVNHAQNLLRERIDLPNLDDKKKTLLDTLSENHPAITPFIEKTDIITQITEAFLRFFRWLLDIPAPFPLPEMEMQFSMHLYRNFDSELMEKIHPNTSPEETRDLPLSFVLKSWCAFLEKSEASTSIDSSALKRCIEYQEKIENARSSKWWASGIIDGLESSITNQIQELQPGQSAYLPGGVMVPKKGIQSDMDNKALSALKTASSAKPVEMIYEIRKNEDGSGLTWRVYNYSTQASNLMKTPFDPSNLPELLKNITTEKKDDAYQEYQLTEEEFLKNLRDLLEVQAFSHKALGMGIFGRIKYVYQGIKAALNGELAGNNSNFTLNALKDVSMVRFSNIFNEYKPKIVNSDAPKHQVTFSLRTNSEKLYEVFAKSLGIKELKTEKLLLKATLFLDIYEKTKIHLEDASWRKWVKDNGIHLLKLIKKEVGNQPGLTNMEGKLGQIMDEIAQKTAIDSITNPLSPAEQKKSDTAFDDPLVFSLQQHAMTAFSPVNKTKNFTSVAPLQAIDFEKASFEEVKNQFTLWIDRCNDLSNQEKLDELSLLLNDAFGGIHFAEKCGFWDKIPLEEVEEWSGMIRLMGQFATQVHFGTDTRGPLPQRLYQLLKILKICQQLALRNREVTCFDGYCVDMAPMRDVLHDPYLDLGVVGPKMHELLNTIEKPDSKKLRLVKTSVLDFKEEELAKFLKSEEGSFFTKCLEKQKQTNPELVEKDLLADLGQKGTLPSQIVHLRQLNILILMMAAKYRTLHVPGLGNRVKIFFKGMIRSLKDKNLGKNKNGFDRSILFEQMALLDSYLASKKLPNSFENEASIGAAFWETAPKINPYGIYMNDYDEILFYSRSSLGNLPFLSTHFPSIYDETGEKIRTNKIRKRIVEGAVADNDGVPVQEDGTPYLDQTVTTTTINSDGS